MQGLCNLIKIFVEAQFLAVAVEDGLPVVIFELKPLLLPESRDFLDDGGFIEEDMPFGDFGNKFSACSW